MNFKVDLHTHSTDSPDGGISAREYEKVVEDGLLDCIAVTDHNTIDLALQLNAKLGDKIIVGEEIMTSAGEIIGLFLHKRIPAGLTPKETIQQIKAQGGVVYIPHPFETVRKGLHPQILEEISDQVDIVEVCNGRAFFQNKSQQAVVWTKLAGKMSASSSDAHGVKGLGQTYTLFSEIPTKQTFLKLASNNTLITDRPSFRSLLYPKYNRLKKRIKK